MVRTIGTLYTLNQVKVPPGTKGRVLRGCKDWVHVKVPQGTIKCAPWRVEEIE